MGDAKLKLIIRKISGLVLVFAIIVVWAIYSYKGDESVLTSSGEIISRN